MCIACRNERFESDEKRLEHIKEVKRVLNIGPFNRTNISELFEVTPDSRTRNGVKVGDWVSQNVLGRDEDGDFEVDRIWPAPGQPALVVELSPLVTLDTFDPDTKQTTGPDVVLLCQTGLGWEFIAGESQHLHPVSLSNGIDSEWLEITNAKLSAMIYKVEKRIEEKAKNPNKDEGPELPEDMPEFLKDLVRSSGALVKKLEADLNV